MAVALACLLAMTGCASQQNTIAGAACRGSQTGAIVGAIPGGAFTVWAATKGGFDSEVGKGIIAVGTASALLGATIGAGIGALIGIIKKTHQPRRLTSLAPSSPPPGDFRWEALSTGPGAD
jgi:hypothetical protein